MATVGATPPGYAAGNLTGATLMQVSNNANLVALIATMAASAEACCTMEGVATAWRRALANADDVWEQLALRDFPRLQSMVNPAHISYRERYRRQHLATYAETAPEDPTEDLSCFQCTVEWLFVDTAKGSRKLLCTTTTRLVVRRGGLPVAAAFSDETVFLPPMKDAEGLKQLAVATKTHEGFKLGLDIYLSRQSDTRRLYRGESSYFVDDETLCFEEVPLAGNIGQLSPHVEIECGELWLFFTTPESENTRSGGPSREFYLSEVCYYLQRGLPWCLEPPLS